MTKPVPVCLAIEREWNLFAFPAGVTPTDERGISLTAEDLANLTKRGNEVLMQLAEQLTDERDALLIEVAPLRELAAEVNRNRALAALEGK